MYCTYIYYVFNMLILKKLNIYWKVLFRLLTTTIKGFWIKIIHASVGVYQVPYCPRKIANVKLTPKQDKAELETAKSLTAHKGTIFLWSVYMSLWKFAIVYSLASLYCLIICFVLNKVVWALFSFGYRY